MELLKREYIVVSENPNEKGLEYVTSLLDFYGTFVPVGVQIKSSPAIQWKSTKDKKGVNQLMEEAMEELFPNIPKEQQLFFVYYKFPQVFFIPR